MGGAVLEKKGRILRKRTVGSNQIRGVGESNGLKKIV